MFALTGVGDMKLKQTYDKKEATTENCAGLNSAVLFL